MREDMSHVIVERPRLGGHGGRKGRAVPLDSLPTHEGMRREHVLCNNRKRLNENLSPLRRYLERQVGRPWDKVYSEITRHLRTDNTVQQHVRDHLSDFVAVKPRRRPHAGFGLGSGLWFQPLYVDPRDGLLKRTDQLPEAKALRRQRQARPAPPERIVLAADRELRRINGLWFEVTLATLPDPVYRAYQEIPKIPLKPLASKGPLIEVAMTVRRLATPSVKDAVSGARVAAGPEIDEEQAWRAFRWAHPDRRYAASKRALARGELRRHGLSNCPA